MTSSFSIFGEWSGNVRSTPTPKDCLRTVNVSRKPESLALDADALEDLDALPVALDHLEVDAQRIACLELRQVRAHVALLEALDDVFMGEDGLKRPAGMVPVEITIVFDFPCAESALADPALSGNDSL